MAPQRADVGIFPLWKGGEDQRDYRANRKFLGETQIIRQILKTFHVEEEKLDEENYDTYGSSGAGML